MATLPLGLGGDSVLTLRPCCQDSKILCDCPLKITLQATQATKVDSPSWHTGDTRHNPTHRLEASSSSKIRRRDVSSDNTQRLHDTQSTCSKLENLILSSEDGSIHSLRPAFISKYFVMLDTCFVLLRKQRWAPEGNCPQGTQPGDISGNSGHPWTRIMGNRQSLAPEMPHPRKRNGPGTQFG